LRSKRKKRKGGVKGRRGLERGKETHGRGAKKIRIEGQGTTGKEREEKAVTIWGKGDSGGGGLSMGHGGRGGRPNMCSKKKYQGGKWDGLVDKGVEREKKKGLREETRENNRSLLTKHRGVRGKSRRERRGANGGGKGLKIWILGEEQGETAIGTRGKKGQKKGKRKLVANGKRGKKDPKKQRGKETVSVWGGEIKREGAEGGGWNLGKRGV